MTATFRVLASLVFIVAASATAHAQVAIDSSAVAAGGITAGDTAGYPATISTSGSFKLIGNLTLLSTVTDAIDITANDVTLDLNGFTVSSTAVCTATAPTGSSCYMASGTAQVLVKITGSRVTLKNGNIRGSNGRGINIVGDEVVVDGVNVSNSITYGIVASASNILPTISNSSVTLAGGNGLLMSSGRVGGTVRNSTFNHNYAGMQVDQGLIEDVTASYNIDYGIEADASIVNRSTSSSNGGTGILYGRVLRDSVSDHNTVDGFASGSYHTLYINTSAEGNSGKGFNLGTNACYTNINADTNTGGQIVGGVQLTGTHVTCP